MTQQTPSQTPRPTPAPASKQYIRASVDDDVLEPDALRGSEQVVKEAGVKDEDAEKRKKQEEK